MLITHNPRREWQSQGLTPRLGIWNPSDITGGQRGPGTEGGGRAQAVGQAP